MTRRPETVGCTLRDMANVYESAARASKVDRIMTALWEVLGLTSTEDALRIDTEVLAQVPAGLRCEFCGLVAETRPPSDETWAQVVASVKLRQRWASENLAAETDPFEGL